MYFLSDIKSFLFKIILPMGCVAQVTLMEVKLIKRGWLIT